MEFSVSLFVEFQVVFAENLLFMWIIRVIMIYVYICLF